MPKVLLEIHGAYTLAMGNRTLKFCSNIENLVLWARSEEIGCAPSYALE